MTEDNEKTEDNQKDNSKNKWRGRKKAQAVGPTLFDGTGS
jgi:hypothetical protein